MNFVYICIIRLCHFFFPSEYLRTNGLAESGGSVGLHTGLERKEHWSKSTVLPISVQELVKVQWDLFSCHWCSLLVGREIDLDDHTNGLTNKQVDNAKTIFVHFWAETHSSFGSVADLITGGCWLHPRLSILSED